MNTQRLAITGARGRLAPGLMRALSALEYEITAFSRTADSDFQSLHTLTEPEILGRFDAIIHLAWSTVPLLSEENPRAEESRDLPLLRSLIEAQGKLARPPLLIFLSTAAVYGNTGDDPVTEAAECRPIGRYASAKLQAERLLAGSPSWCALRVTNVFGRLSLTETPQGIIPKLYAASHGGNPATIWGDGSATKDYLFESDFHAAIEAALRFRLRGTFNVSAGHSLSLREIVRLVENAVGRPLQLNHRPRYPWDVENSHVSSEKISQATGWRPQWNASVAIQTLMAAGEIP